MSIYFGPYAAPGNLNGEVARARALFAQTGVAVLRGAAGRPTMQTVLGGGVLSGTVARGRILLLETGVTPEGVLQVVGPHPTMRLANAPLSIVSLLRISVPPPAFNAHAQYTVTGFLDGTTDSPMAVLLGQGVNVLRMRSRVAQMNMQQKRDMLNYAGFSSSAVMLVTGDTASLRNWLSDGLVGADTLEGHSILALLDTLRMAVTTSVSVNSKVGVNDVMTLADFAGLLLHLALSDQAHITDTPNGWMGMAQRLHDALFGRSNLASTVDLRVSLSLALAVREYLKGAQALKLDDGTSVADTLLGLANHYAALFDALQATAAATGHTLLFALLNDSAALDDAVDIIAQVKQALMDGGLFGMTLYTGQDTYTAWVMTPETRAMRRYTNYAFNSYALIDGALFAAGSRGIYELTGDDDDGTPIVARARTGLLDFGSRQLKSMDRLYLGYTSSGTLCMRAVTTAPDGRKTETTYKMVQVAADAPRAQRIPIGRGLRSVYWQFEIDNSADASDFELSDITVLPIVLARRIAP